MSELKPCPFCGGEAHIQPEGDYHEIHCENCGIELDRRTYDEAATAWNTRTDTAKLAQIRACIESYRIKKNESDPFEYGRFQEWRAIKTDIDDILEGEK